MIITNCIILAVLIHSIMAFTLKDKVKSNAYCGLFGFVGGGGFDLFRMCILGIYNDTRGGDSTGVSLDGTHYGSKGNKNKLFRAFIAEENPFDELAVRPKVALGHCRKASVGGIGEAQAQPVYIKENGKVKFVMIHNGTLVNYKELAKKYEVEYEASETDSQIFCKIVYKAGYKVLGEYIGAGAFVFHDLRINKVFAFKGNSKMYNNSANTEDERPFYILKSGGGYYFSSIKESLSAIRKNNDGDVMTIKANTLTDLTGGILGYANTYDRANLHQLESKYAMFDEYGYNTTLINRGGGYNPNKEVILTSKLILERNYKNTEAYMYHDEDGFYNIGGKPFTGAVLTSSAGWIYDKNDGFSKLNGPKYNGAIFETYFMRGIKMNSKVDFYACNYFIQKFVDKYDSDLNDLSEEEKQDLLGTILAFSNTSVKIGGLFKTVKKGDLINASTIYLVPLFQSGIEKHYYILSGKVYSYKKESISQKDLFNTPKHSIDGTAELNKMLENNSSEKELEEFYVNYIKQNII